MFSGSVRTHTYFYQPHLFSGSQGAAGPGRPAWTFGSHVWESRPWARSASRPELAEAGPRGSGAGNGELQGDHVPGSFGDHGLSYLLRPSPVTEDPCQSHRPHTETVTGLTHHTGPNLLFV